MLFVDADKNVEVDEISKIHGVKHNNESELIAKNNIFKEMRSMKIRTNRQSTFEVGSYNIIGFIISIPWLV